jgi:hypothetical protein
MTDHAALIKRLRSAKKPEQLGKSAPCTVCWNAAIEFAIEQIGLAVDEPLKPREVE